MTDDGNFRSSYDCIEQIGKLIKSANHETHRISTSIRRALGSNMDSDLKKALDTEDDLGIVIRSHIVIEQCLNRLIKTQIHSLKHYEKMNLDFEQVVDLAIALGLNPRFESFLSALGTLRNGFAHKLGPTITDQDAKNLYMSLNKTDKEVLQSCLNKTLKTLPGEDIAQYRDLEAKDKFILNIVVLCGALEVACRKLPNSEIKRTENTSA